MSNAHDHTTLKWIRGELDALIKQSRDALEVYVEGVGEAEQLDGCITPLHQVRGTLQMVQAYGAAMLAEEMELVASALRDGNIQRRDDAAEALMLGLVHLSDHLEKLEAGASDMPLLVLPMLNELRASRDAPLLSEVALFAPELEQKLAGSGELQGEASEELPALVRGIRFNYHKGLLNWYRDIDTDGGLRGIGEVLKQIEQAAGTEQVKRLFHAARAVTEGLREGSIKAGIAGKELFGRLDREIKRIIDGGEAPFAISPATDLLKNLLYYIASADSENPLLVSTKQSYGLDQGLFGQDQAVQQNAGLQGLGQDLVLSLKSAISDDLTTIKDGLDLFIRGKSSDMSRLFALVMPMRKIADTLGMIGQGGLRERLKRQADLIEEAGKEPGQPLDEQVLMDMAGDILFVETSLENLANARNLKLESAAPAAGHRELPQGEFEKLVDSVMHEAEVDIAKNKEAIIGFIENPGNPELLQQVPQRFRSIAGAFRIMGLDEAADLLDGLSNYVDSALLGTDTIPPTEHLNTFADAMTSIEYFMEAVTEGRGVQENILQVARDALVQLGVGATSDSDAEDQAAAERSSSGLPELTVEAGISRDKQPPVEEVSSDAPPQPAKVAESPASADKPPLDEIEPEILEIFLEEAREELSVIQEYLPRWCKNHEDRESLTTFRRSFHTLKGSGRLVGAMTIGEYAWSIENLLNRVIDETVEISPEIIGLLEQTIDVLPELIDCQESGATPKVDVQPMMARAFDLANPEKTAAAEAEHEQPGPAGEPAVDAAGQVDSGDTEEIEIEPPEMGAVVPFPGLDALREEESGGQEQLPAIVMDSMLLDIFASETRDHIGSLRTFVERCRISPQDCNPFAGEIPRTLHTLHGSADMAGVRPIAEVSRTLEDCISQLEKTGDDADDSLLGLIEASADTLEQILGAINVADAKLPDWSSLVDDIEILRQRLLEQSAVRAQDASHQGEEVGQDVSLELATEGAGDREPDSAAAGQDSATDRQHPLADIGSSEYIDLDGDPELIEIFLEEANELIESIESSLQQWRQAPDAGEPIDDLQRTLHTLKGGARLAGVLPVGDLSHAFESLLSEVGHGQITMTPELFSLAQAVIDRLVGQTEDLAKAPRVRNSDDLVQRMERASSSEGMARQKPAEADAGRETSEPVAEQQPGGGEAAEPVLTISTDEDAIPAQPVSPPKREQIRVRSDLLDRLVNNAGEVSIYRARLEQHNGALGFNLSELEQTVERLRGQLRNLDIETEAQILFRYEQEKKEGQMLDESFDPLELDRFSNMQQLSRGLMETVNDLVNINEYLDDLHKETETLLQQQRRVTNDLQDGLLRTRMVPFAQLVPRLQRVVRQTAASLGKQAQLEVYGAEGELDRGILDRMIGPLEHLLRNAVSHGIESPEQRREASKDEVGRIAMYLAREGNDVILTITDDGSGLNIDRIRQRAIERGLLDPNAEVPDSDILQFVLEHGFSTTDQVTQISGRGVGLDVVVKEVKQLGGSLDITSRPEQGTSFIIRLPLTLAISDALLVELGEEIYAIPHTSIEGVVRVSRSELLDSYQGKNPYYSYADQDYRVRYLGSLLQVGQPNTSEQRKWYPLLLVRAGEHRVALQVDSVLGNRQIVVKSVGPQISTIRWISGGTILGDGRVALIIDVTALVRMDAAHTIPAQAEQPQAVDSDVGRLVMVVDDSITVRKVTGRVLERHGMTVVTAKDGVDAVAQLQEHRPDVMLLDIEMPRMDGYELARHMRNTEELKDIPIIMITSRTGDKHRNLAMELGVKRYLGKPYQEADLLDNIHAVLAEAER